MKKMQVIAISNQKGGVGKTSTAVNLAVGLANEGNRVLLIDNDPQANATTGLDMDSKVSPLAEILARRASINQMAEKTPVENLWLIPSHLQHIDTEIHLLSEINRERILEKALRVTEGFDYVIIDCSPSLGVFTINALNVADLIIVPIAPERGALDGFGNLLTKILDLRDVPPHHLVRILVSKIDSRNKIANDFLFGQLENYSYMMFETQIRRHEDINKANIAQKSMYQYNSKSEASDDYKKLAQEVMAYVKGQGAD